MKNFLIDDLGMSEERVQCLLSSEDPTAGDPLTPSRDNIVRVLYSLISNQEFDPGDNILIYFAGYGASYRSIFSNAHAINHKILSHRSSMPPRPRHFRRRRSLRTRYQRPRARHSFHGNISRQGAYDYVHRGLLLRSQFSPHPRHRNAQHTPHYSF
ncbi:hypothetical protein ARMSODRAFT_740258 [Armillaria solidipes]|uniref:Uncharacterized protein n=1 Tax=Armillaria solidipes TaxID=1076256 RepID=A0A2H3C131_9AGAR|nr:hypothetical protein ARMSODRAFT_740258 [Armillaria solidipes]